MPFGFVLGLIISAALVFGLWQGVASVEKSGLERQKQSLEDVIMKSVTHCYATSGFYPDSLDYLEENYGITYDKETFAVMYSCFADNICPEITVIQKKQ